MAASVSSLMLPMTLARNMPLNMSGSYSMFFATVPPYCAVIFACCLGLSPALLALVPTSTRRTCRRAVLEGTRVWVASGVLVVGAYMFSVMATARVSEHAVDFEAQARAAWELLSCMLEAPVAFLFLVLSLSTPVSVGFTLASRQSVCSAAFISAAASLIPALSAMHLNLWSRGECYFLLGVSAAVGPMSALVGRTHFCRAELADVSRSTRPRVHTE